MPQAYCRKQEAFEATVRGPDIADPRNPRLRCQMSSTESPPFVFDSPPFFTANWLGRHPGDHEPQMVECFGPSAPDDYAAVQAAVLGLESALMGKPPPTTSLQAEVVDQRLVVYSHDQELLRTEHLPESALAALRRRPEVLLVWVDVPLRDARTELPTVGIQHVWTGIAQVRGGVR
jgi:hypothetical protein